MYKTITRAAAVTIGLFVLGTGTAASAGEVKGNGQPLDLNGRSECVYSGLNDLDGDPRDPGYRTQNYGQLVGPAGWIDPSQIDPRTQFPIPGFACNPNRGNDLKDD